MPAEEIIQATLTGDAALTAIVPAERIRLRGDNRGIPMPFVVHGPIVDRYEPTFDGVGRRWIGVYQVSVLAKTAAIARAAADRIAELLGGLRAEGVNLEVTGRTWSSGRDPEFYHHVAIELSGVS
jgi:hypothetical protein